MKQQLNLERKILYDLRIKKRDSFFIHYEKSMYENIKNILKNLNISFDEIEHEVSMSCEHSREIRNKA